MLRTVLLPLLLSQLGLARPAAEAPTNIVLIVADDLGWRDLACQGSKFYETPRIDRLAREGLRLTHGYSNGPNCAPTRACLMTGLYAPRHGIYTVGSSARGKKEFRRWVPIKNKTVLAESFVTIPELLKKAGYRTGFFGKWHLGPDAKTQGFDVNVAGCQMGHPKSYFSPYHNPQIQDGEDGEYLTDRLTSEAIRFVQANASKPFFCQLSFYAVHTPIQPKPGAAKPFRGKAADGAQKNARYAGMVATMDANVGRLVDAIDAAGLREKTLIVFISDNGGLGRVTSNAPLRGSKGMLYEGGVRVPWIVRQPGRVQAATLSRVPVITSDLLATFARLAGVKKLPRTDGVDLGPLFFAGEDDTAARAGFERALYWHFPAYLAANARKGTWRTTPASAMRVGKYKLLQFFEDGHLELYDLDADPGESKNLINALPGLAVDLEARLASWRYRVAAKIPSELTER